MKHILSLFFKYTHTHTHTHTLFLLICDHYSLSERTVLCITTGIKQGRGKDQENFILIDM